MNNISNNQTVCEVYLTLKRHREDLVAAIDHFGYSISIELPNETQDYECTTTEENDRYTLLEFTLDAFLEDGEYPFKVYSMSAAGVLEADRNELIRVGRLRVTKTATIFTEHTTISGYVEHS
jgi:hypothetical protein